MIIRILFIVSALNIFNIAQDIKVLETEKLPIENGYNPKFILNDSKIVFSKSNYKGLYLFDSATKTTSTISNEDGAGYNPLISQSDKIIFRETKFIKGKKFHDLNSFDIISNTVEQIESNKRSLKLPSQKFTDDIILINENEIETKKLSENRAAKSSNLKKAVFINNGKIILVDNEVKKELQPVGDGIYVWASLSNDQTMITFSFGNRGSFISDLNGKILANIPEAHFPKFSPNDKFISYMNDKDDGTKYISSDIFVYSIETEKSYQITDSENIFEVNPEWSNDGQSLIYNTIDGDIYISKFQFEN